MYLIALCITIKFVVILVILPSFFVISDQGNAQLEVRFITASTVYENHKIQKSEKVSWEITSSMHYWQNFSWTRWDMRF